jgi:hypothetical protein
MQDQNAFIEIHQKLEMSRYHQGQRRVIEFFNSFPKRFHENSNIFLVAFETHSFLNFFLGSRNH